MHLLTTQAEQIRLRKCLLQTLIWQFLGVLSEAKHRQLVFLLIVEATVAKLYEILQKFGLYV